MLGARQSRDDGSNKDERAANRLPKAPVDGDAFKLQTLQTSPIGRAGPARRELASLQSPDSRPPPTMPARLTPSPRRPTNPGRRCRVPTVCLRPPYAGAGSREACASARALGPCPCSTSRGAATKRWFSNLPFAAQWAATSWPMTSIPRTIWDCPAGPPSVVREAFQGPLVAGSDHIPRKERKLRLVSAKVD